MSERLVSIVHRLWGARNSTMRKAGAFRMGRDAGIGLEQKIREKFDLGAEGLCV